MLRDVYFNKNKMLWLTLTNLLIILNDIFVCNVQAIDSVGMLQKRIANGEDAQLFEFPFQVAIKKKIDGSWSLQCGGALVAPDRVLTTYSCVAGTKPNNVRVSVGVLNMFGPPNQYEQTIYVSKIYRHESIKDKEFEVLGSHNIAVLTLISPVTLNKNVQIARLAENVSKYLETYETMKMEPRCKMSGWGYTDRRNLVSNTLQKASTRIVDYKLCQQWWPMVKVALEEGMYLCTMDMNVYESSQKPTLRGPCYGDGGAPLMCGANNEKLELVGLAISGTMECSDFGREARSEGKITLLFLRIVTPREHKSTVYNTDGCLRAGLSFKFIKSCSLPSPFVLRKVWTRK